MAELPIQHQPTVDKIYKYYVDKNIEWRRPHLGASLIGEDCQRKLWYSFRHCSSPNFIGRMQRLFATGKIEEERIINDLRNIGVCVYDRDPSSGKQLSCFDEDCPHHSGSVDGNAKGVEE
ncbi:MAG: oxidoreductase, partial [archaeon]